MKKKKEFENLQIHLLYGEITDILCRVDILSLGIAGLFTMNIINGYIVFIIFIVIAMNYLYEINSVLKALHYIDKKRNSYLDITSGYIFSKKVKDFKKNILLWLCIPLFELLEKQNILLSRYTSILLIVLFSLVVIRDYFIKYRIRKGLFATNRTEARELIDFIIKNSDKLDFTDSNGNLRRALLPEAKDAVEEHIPGTLGEEAHA